VPIDSLAPLTQLQPLVPLGGASLGVSALADAQPAGTGFAAVLNGLLDSNRAASATADAAVRDLATGEAQDLHTVSLAVAQADLSFRLILELRNRLADAFQEVSRMQV
jgi:flagellar hook-basal body complex protein FliE